MRFFRVLPVMCAALGLFSVASSVQANTFVWQDPQTGLQMSFPDRWARGLNEEVGDVLTIYAPAIEGRNDFASCRVRVSDDKRFTVQPRGADIAIQRVALAQDFWADYVGLHRSARVHALYNGYRFGQGVGSRAEISFVTDNGALVQKRGMVVATIYNDKLYAFECSADRKAFARWAPVFQAIFDTVQIKAEHGAYSIGYYRNFL